MAEEKPKKEEPQENLPELKADRDDSLGYTHEQFDAELPKPEEAKKKASKRKKGK